MDGNLVKPIETGITQIDEIEIIDENTLFHRSSKGLLRSLDGGLSWEESSNKRGTILGFEGGHTGIILERSTCIQGGDVFVETKLFSSTFDGGLNWEDADETTTNIFILNYSKSQKMGHIDWKQLIRIDTKLISQTNLTRLSVFLHLKKHRKKYGFKTRIHPLMVKVGGYSRQFSTNNPLFVTIYYTNNPLFVYFIYNFITFDAARFDLKPEK